MSLIEQAAKRLEELRRAGAEMPAAGNVAPHPGGTPGPSAANVPTPEAAIQALEARTAESDGSRHGRHGSAPAPATRPVDAPPTLSAQTRFLDIDIELLKKGGFVTPDDPRSQIADEFRVIKRPIIRNALAKAPTSGPNRNLVMVTSALPGEGKTFTAINLAISVAMEFDNTVLLVDGDVAHPSLPGVLGCRVPRAFWTFSFAAASMSPMPWSKPTSKT